ncbi:hypothetical protein KEM52_004609 [Ascosphaera acerosa]|nr:hypothetical protein KEM52_004609 [Ascosphaera acerosa]
MADVTLQRIDDEIKDVIQTLWEIQAATLDYSGPTAQQELASKISSLTEALQKLHSDTRPPYDAPSQPPLTVASSADENATATATAGEAPSQADNPPLRSIHLPPEIVDYVDSSRNPDIYTREFVELVQRANQNLKGKTEAFALFRDVLAEEMASQMPELSGEVARTLAAVGQGPLVDPDAEVEVEAGAEAVGAAGAEALLSLLRRRFRMDRLDGRRSECPSVRGQGVNVDITSEADPQGGMQLQGHEHRHKPRARHATPRHAPRAMPMGPSNPVADWQKVGSEFYRKVRLYDNLFGEDLELENFHVVGAPFAGALAIYRDESKIQRYKSSQSTRPVISLYSCSGRQISQINWDYGAIRGIGWSEDEQLVVVTRDGSVRCYNGLHGDFTPFSLGIDPDGPEVKSCRFWRDGFVALLDDNQLISVSGYHEPRPRRLATVPAASDAEVVSWAVIPPHVSLSRSVEVLLAIDATIYSVDATEAEDKLLEAGPFRHLNVSPNGRFAVMYTASGKVWVVSSDFQNKFSEYDAKARTAPSDLLWCGNDCVVLCWEDELHLVGSDGQALEYLFDGRVHLVPEPDGLRLITNDACDFLHKVPRVTETIFKFGSSAPASVLLDAVGQMEKNSPKADENIQRIRPDLAEAVDMCVEAAGQEVSVYWQKQLLKAASFGKSFLDFYSSDAFVEMTERLRVLNAVRDYRVGLPLSMEQFLRLTPEKLLERLTSRREYLLAIKISEYLQLPTDRVYVQWASQKVRSSTEDDETICQLVVKKLHGKRGISYESIAQAAYAEGRGHLAVQLLDQEPRAGKQVPLLLSMEEDALALERALESGDTDLILYVLFAMKRKLPLASFFRAINAHPTAGALIEKVSQTDDVALLRDLYYQDDRSIDGSNLTLREALQETDLSQAIDKISVAARSLTDVKNSAVAFQQAALTEAAQLLKVQQGLQTEIADNVNFVGMSVNETIYRLNNGGFTKRAAKLQAEFRVPEKTFWWIQLRAMVAKRDWGGFSDIAKNKKSPIGWEPFFNEVLAAGNTKLAAVFIPKCTHLSVDDRIEMWLKCGLVTHAAEEALKAKDLVALEQLRTRASGSAIAEIERMIKQLR